MDIENAIYLQHKETNVAIEATIDGKIMSVPIREGNRHYDEIMRQVEAGTLTIAEA